MNLTKLIRRLIKGIHEPLVICWVVNDRYTNNFVSLYNQVKEYPNIKFILIASPRLDPYGFGSDTSTEITEAIRLKGFDCLDSLDNHNNGMLQDINGMRPDYVFYSTPYDEYLPMQYRSEELCQYTKVCHISYGATMVDLSRMKHINGYDYENQFYENAYMHFIPSGLEHSASKNEHVIGYLKLDPYRYKIGAIRNSIHQVMNDRKPYVVVWKPRWTLQQEDSTFLEFITHMYNLLASTESLHLILLAHPFFFSSLKKCSMEKEVFVELNKLEQMSNFSLRDDTDYLEWLLDADAYIGPHSSTLVEFSTTGKPIIYLETEAILNQLGEYIVSGSYHAASFSEMEKILMGLISNDDPLAYRRSIVRSDEVLGLNTTRPIADSLLEYLQAHRYDIINKQKQKKIWYNKKYHP